MRADPAMLATFTETLTDLGFRSAGISAEGLQHRWIRGDASLDVLLPDGIGERASLRPGVTGSPTLPTAGGTQALQRSETVRVSVAGREGSVRRPNLVGALDGSPTTSVCIRRQSSTTVLWCASHRRRVSRRRSATVSVGPSFRSRRTRSKNDLPP